MSLTVPTNIEQPGTIVSQSLVVHTKQVLGTIFKEEKERKNQQ